MKKIVTGLSMLSMLAFAAGCSDDNTWATGAGNTGKATFALTNDDFRLTATISIHAPDEGDPSQPGALVRTVDTDEADDQLSVELEVGSYIPVMGDWSLFAGEDLEPRGTSDDPNDVEFLNFAPLPVVITDGGNTAVSANFRVGDVAVDFDPLVTGNANVSLVATSGDCDPGCGGGTECATIDEGPAFCATTCNVVGLDSLECGGRACLEGAAFNICEPA